MQCLTRSLYINAMPCQELLKQFQEVEQLPDEDKNVINKLLDAFLTKNHL